MHARTLLATLLLATGAFATGCTTLPRSAAPADGARLDLAILETTDVHANVLGYDYYQLKPDPSLGYERTATLIRAARREFPNTLLFDSGDTIQGTVLADYQAQVAPVSCAQRLAIYAAMNTQGYDGGTAGNHEFNYGLGFLSQVTGTPMHVEGGETRRCAGPDFPLVLANVDSALDGQPIFPPWKLLERRFEAWSVDGSRIEVPLRVAIIGFTPPPIMHWDRVRLAGKVKVSGVIEAAERYLPAIRAARPDLVIAILHGGLDAQPYTPDMENAGWHLAGLDGIDVLLLGHSHTSFPGPRFAGLPEVDAKRGLVRGKPAAMGGFFGKDLGVVRLQLLREGRRWVLDPHASRSEVRPICRNDHDCVAPDPEIRPLVEAAHEAAIRYVNTPIGDTRLELSSWFADVGDMRALAVVNAAQRDYVRRELPREHPELADIPVLAAAAAFRTGYGGAEDYTHVAPGPLTLRSAADLYFYPNTLAAVKTDGAGLKAWLERSAERFNRIDPSRTTTQALLNPRFPGYNFDQIQGDIHYVIDVSQPVGQRISGLTWQGRPVTPSQPFIIATNNYRAGGGGHFAGLDGSQIVLTAPDGTREILARWLERQGTLDVAAIEPRSWRFAPLALHGPVTFTTAAGKLATARTAGLDNIEETGPAHDGIGTYTIHFPR